MKIPFRKYFKLFGKYLKPQMNYIVILGFLLVISLGLNLLSPQILAKFIDLAVEKKSAKTLTMIALLFMVLAFIQQLILILTTYLSQNIGWKATNALREELIEHCIHLDMSFHKSHKHGELIERLDGDVTALFNFFAKLFINLLTNIALLIGIIVMLFIKDYRVGISMSIFAMIAMAVFAYIEKIAVPRYVKEREQAAEFFGFVGEQITSTEDIKSQGAVSYVMFRLYQILKQMYSVRKNAFVMYGYMWSATLIIFALGYVVAFGLSSYLYSINAITIGSVYLIISYTDLLSRPIEQIRAQLQDLQRASASIVRVEELFATTSNLTDGTKEIAQGPLNLQFKNVSFKYEDGVQVLNNISFKLEKGKVLGLLGRTGSGKTSLARLVVRLYDVSQGHIYLNHQDIRNLQIKNLRNKIAYVTQDVQIFKASVRNNLTFYNPNITDDDILEVMRKIGLVKWLSTLPNGLDTMLDSEGQSLSAGEAQLLSFVRVFLKNPQLVILDEASSRLDPITEHLIEQAINELLKDRTSIIIAHRLKTIERADQILILENGNVIENGNRVQLSQDTNSRFHHLLKTGIEEVLV